MTKTDHNDAKIIALSTLLSKLEKTIPLLQHSKEEEITELIPVPTLKEGNPARLILRDLTVLNPGVSRYQRKRLPDMAKIGDGDPSTIQKGNLMECT